MPSPVPISITTLPNSISDLDIEITSEEEPFYPTREPEMDKQLEFKAGLPEDFSGKEEDAMRWLLAMKAYFRINNHIYKDDKMVILVFFNKMSTGSGVTFTEGWYIKLVDP